MTGNPITDLITMLFPSMTAGLATTISSVVTFLIGLVVAIPAVGLWIRSKLPTIIAFIAYVYNEALKAEGITKKDKNDIETPLAGADKKDIVMSTLSKELLNPKNEIVTEKNLKLFKKITGWAGTLGSIVEFVVPIVKTIVKKKTKP